MKKVFNKDRFRAETKYAEYIDLYLIIVIAIVTYVGYGVSFVLYAYSHILFITQVLSVLICVAAFIVNQLKAPRAAAIIMVLLICSSISIWA